MDHIFCVVKVKVNYATTKKNKSIHLSIKKILSAYNREFSTGLYAKLTRAKPHKNVFNTQYGTFGRYGTSKLNKLRSYIEMEMICRNG